MKRYLIYHGTLCLTLLLGFTGAQASTPSYIKGIYLTQNTVENTARVQRLLRQSQQYGINTFVIDMTRLNARYMRNIQRIKRAHVHYIARIVVFPNGGSRSQVTQAAYWKKRYRLVEKALAAGAEAIQLDYIRYSTRNRPSLQNAKDIEKVIRYFKQRLQKKNIPLQIATFGESAFGPSYAIGQDLRRFAPHIDSLAPMLYPSHFEPYRLHAKQPYQTVFSALEAIQTQFHHSVPFTITPYIELSNYRYRLSEPQKWQYIRQQILASEAAGANGWLAWSANNRYQRLFKTLALYKLR